MAKTIGLTGGIGTGKTVVAKIFSMLGADIYNADAAARKLMTEDATIILHIKHLLGALSYNADGSLNRTYVADKIYQDETLRKKLNEIVHPVVIENGKNYVLSSKHNYVIKEAAILFESGSDAYCDKIILVSSPLEMRINRVMQRDGRNREEVLKVIASQMPEEEKIRKSDFIIYNDEKQSLITQTMQVHAQLLI
ncbi:MAG: dephospho-CoA kinase [Bacteroidetes bacterium]|nr:dephospho-CoA kinase [Bacteroidota bacterium]